MREHFKAVMSLKEYEQKRHFDQTPEPKPGVPVKSAEHSGRFFIQRHDATRLHYDFRLEIDGTLKSWAVPKGPTLDPAPKRLAAMVEDHPLDYGDFEGNIPKGEYGGGSVMLWDRGTFELIGDQSGMEQIARGDLKFKLQGEKLKGDFALVHMKNRGKGNEWLLLKKKDAEARPGWDVEEFARSVKTGRTQDEIAGNLESAKPAKVKKKVTGASEPAPTARSLPLPAGAIAAELPQAITPMSATLARVPPKGGDWVFEIKWDGIRAICFVDNGELRIQSRAGIRCERQYPELSVLPHYVSAKQAILDGEIAVLDDRGVSSFTLIQPRITNQDANAVAHMARSRPVTLFLFDLLYLDGYDLRKVPLIERKKLLASLVSTNSLVRLSDHFATDGEQMLEAARQQGLEGLLAKCTTSVYESRRSRNWLKLKLVSHQEFAICGYTEGERDYFGSLVLGLYEKGNLVYVGNVGTGFDNKLMAAIYERIERLAIARAPFADPPKLPGKVIWVRPEVVCEVKFSNWTRDRRLRAPVFMGLRLDVDPKACVREEPVEESERVQPAKSAVLLPGKENEVTVTADGRKLKLTNLNKTYYPGEGYTKRDLLNYYDAVSGLLLPHLEGRPLSLRRYPNGIGQEFFFQKHSPESYPSWMRYVTAEGIRYVVAEDRASLLYLTNLGCIDQNPWMSRAGSLDNPDFILIDLDPHGCEYDRIVEAAQLVRKKLDAVGLEGYPKTTGGDGMHIYVPVEPQYTYEQTKAFAEVLARIVAAERPDLFTTPRSVARRDHGKVYFDYLQNGQGKTIAAPYVVRAYAGAPVAAPLAWREVCPGLLPSQFTIRNVLPRFERAGDLFEGVLKQRQTLEGPLSKLEKLILK